MKLYRCKNKTHTKKEPSTKTEGGFCAVPDLRHYRASKIKQSCDT